MDGPKSVLLIGFANMTSTGRLRDLADWRPWTPPVLGADNAIRRSSLQLGDGGMSDELRRELCQDRTCFIIGRAEGDVYRFVKVRDY